MQFLNHLLYLAYVAKPALAPIISFRMVEISIKYGICNITPFAFGVYGAFLVSAISADNEGGYRMGRVAMELMKRMNAIEIIPRLYTAVYSIINIWKEPYQASLTKFLEGFDIGAHNGDVRTKRIIPPYHLFHFFRVNDLLYKPMADGICDLKSFSIRDHVYLRLRCIL